MVCVRVAVRTGRPGTLRAMHRERAERLLVRARARACGINFISVNTRILRVYGVG